MIFSKFLMPDERARGQQRDRGENHAIHEWLHIHRIEVIAVLSLAFSSSI
jgi:hypothetical protein